MALATKDIDINNTQAIFFDDITKTIVLYSIAGEGQFGAFYSMEAVTAAQALMLDCI